MRSDSLCIPTNAYDYMETGSTLAQSSLNWAFKFWMLVVWLAIVKKYVENYANVHCKCVTWLMCCQYDKDTYGMDHANLSATTNHRIYNSSMSDLC